MFPFFQIIYLLLTSSFIQSRPLLHQVNSASSQLQNPSPTPFSTSTLHKLHYFFKSLPSPLSPPPRRRYPLLLYNITYPYTYSISIPPIPKVNNQHTSKTPIIVIILLALLLSLFLITGIPTFFYYFYRYKKSFNVNSDFSKDKKSSGDFDKLSCQESLKVTSLSGQINIAESIELGRVGNEEEEEGDDEYYSSRESLDSRRNSTPSVNSPELQPLPPLTHRETVMEYMSSPELHPPPPCHRRSNTDPSESLDRRTITDPSESLGDGQNSLWSSPWLSSGRN